MLRTRPELLPYSTPENSRRNANIITDWLSDKVATHTKSTPIVSKTEWWSPKLENIHEEIKNLHRKLHYCRKKGKQDEIGPLEKEISDHQGTLRIGIKEAKSMA